MLGYRSLVQVYPAIILFTCMSIQFYIDPGIKVSLSILVLDSYRISTNIRQSFFLPKQAQKSKSVL